jgi:3D (Asp-Asp-Asp) domain-containing protein
MKRRTLIAMLGALALAVASFTALASHPAPASASTSATYLVTLYGWPDNSPPGGAIAYPKSDGNPTLHNTAGGTGTFSNPVTYATDKAELPIGTKVYYPFLKRYFIMEDDCVACDRDWTGHGPDGGPKFKHIDMWVGGKGGNVNKVIDCEDSLTQSGTVIVNPPSNEPVSSTPLFNSSNNNCFKP